MAVVAFYDLSRPRQEISHALARWLSPKTKFEILRAVVISYAVLVMWDLVGAQRPAEALCHDATMFQNPSVGLGVRMARIPDSNVPVGGSGTRPDRSSTLPHSGAPMLANGIIGNNIAFVVEPSEMRVAETARTCWSVAAVYLALSDHRSLDWSLGIYLAGLCQALVMRVAESFCVQRSIAVVDIARLHTLTISVCRHVKVICMIAADMRIENHLMTVDVEQAAVLFQSLRSRHPCGNQSQLAEPNEFSATSGDICSMP